DDVRRLQLLRLARARRLVLAGVDREIEHGVVEAPETGAVEPRRETQLEDGARARLGDRALRRHLLRDGDVALARELERLEFELDLVAVLLPRPELDRPEVEAPYGVRVAARGLNLGRATSGLAVTIRTTPTTIPAAPPPIGSGIPPPRKIAPTPTPPPG